MNRIKGVLVLTLVLMLSFPCFASDLTIKRKKNKWINSIEQTNPGATDFTTRPYHVYV